MAAAEQGQSAAEVRDARDAVDELRLAASALLRLGERGSLTAGDAVQLHRRIAAATDVVARLVAHVAAPPRPLGAAPGHGALPSVASVPSTDPIAATTPPKACVQSPPAVDGGAAERRRERRSSDDAHSSASARPATRPIAPPPRSVPPPPHGASARGGRRAPLHAPPPPPSVPPPCAPACASPRRVPPPPTSSPTSDCTRLMPAVLHSLLECLATLLQCESAHVFVPCRDQLICCAHVAERATFPPSAIRHQLAGSVAGGVLASGVAVSQTSSKGTTDSGGAARSLLLFPIRGVASRRTIGVLQLTNKHRGSSAFTPVDENWANAASHLLGAIMERHGDAVDWTRHFGDPPALRSGGLPFRAVEAHPVLPATATSAAGGDGGSGECDVDRAAIERTVAAVRNFTQQQLIHRATHPVTLSQRQALAEHALGLSAAPSLVEVDGYMLNLRECWRRSVELAVQRGAEERSKGAQVKQLRNELRHALADAAELREQLRLQRLDSDDYRREYATLRVELETFLSRRRTAPESE